jgi:hypothetical protein
LCDSELPALNPSAFVVVGQSGGVIIGYRHICLRLTIQLVDVDGSSRVLAFIAKALKAPILSPHLFQDLLDTAALLTGSQTTCS